MAKIWQILGAEKPMIDLAAPRKQNIERGGEVVSFAHWRKLCKDTGNRCLCCHLGLFVENITRDHIVPVSKGGKNGLENMQPLCAVCNSVKGNRTVDFRNVSCVVVSLLPPEIAHIYNERERLRTGKQRPLTAEKIESKVKNAQQIQIDRIKEKFAQRISDQEEMAEILKAKTKRQKLRIQIAESEAVQAHLDWNAMPRPIRCILGWFGYKLTPLSPDLQKQLQWHLDSGRRNVERD